VNLCISDFLVWEIVRAVGSNSIHANHDVKGTLES
jgi:hypothetical protein